MTQLMQRVETIGVVVGVRFEQFGRAPARNPDRPA